MKSIRGGETRKDYSYKLKWCKIWEGGYGREVCHFISV